MFSYNNSLLVTNSTLNPTPLFFFFLFWTFDNIISHLILSSFFCIYIGPPKKHFICLFQQQSFWLALLCFNNLKYKRFQSTPDPFYFRKMTLSAISINGFKQSGENFLANMCEYVLFDSRSS